MPRADWGIRIDGSILLNEENELISLADFYKKIAQKNSNNINETDIIVRAKRSASSYESSVRKVLFDISHRKTGQAVLNTIQYQTRWMTIIPYFMVEPALPNAFARKDPRPFFPIPRSRHGSHGSDKKGLARIREIRSRNSLIEFTPAHWGGDGPVHALFPFRKYSGAGSEPDEMLLHELVHGLRKMTGTGVSLWSRRRVPGQPLAGSMEEFYAVLIANIYRSECGRPGLRKHYELFPSDDTIRNEDFLKVELNRRHLRQLRRQNSMLFNKLNDVDAPFNPTREFKDR